jgi:hypothetical protein
VVLVSDPDALGRRLISELTLARQSTAPELQRRLGISQATFSRLVDKVGDRLLFAGNARARRYAARRSVEDLGERIPVYAVDEHARARHVLTLHPILPDAFYVEATTPDFVSAFHADLPYFLNDLRPTGFLGRLVPAQHPELELPGDVRVWSGTQTLRYLGRFGWNLPGNLIVGDEAFRLYVAHAAAPPDLVEPRRRGPRYVAFAEGVLATAPGSSAGGEQPKFLVSRRGSVPLIVKFSPPTKTAIGRRQADLLVAEHVAHRTLTKHGRKAARSAVLVAGGRTFLEVERFDRTPSGGRVGVISLWSVDAEFVGKLRSWTDSVASLVERDVVPEALLERVQWLELFGKLIGNTDMHPGNLAFFTAGERIVELAPAYDMLPTRYTGQAGNLFTRKLELDPPIPADSGVWESASRAAIDFWRTLAAERSVSPEFKRLAAANAGVVVAWQRLGELLPARGSAKREARRKGRG